MAFELLPSSLWCSSMLGVPGFAGGYVGVDVFFVVSGYLITSLILAQQAKGQFTLLWFYERRIRRIFPALFVVMLACAVMGWLVMAPNDYKSSWREYICDIHLSVEFLVLVAIGLLRG